MTWSQKSFCVISRYLAMEPSPVLITIFHLKQSIHFKKDSKWVSSWFKLFAYRKKGLRHRDGKDVHIWILTTKSYFRTSELRLGAQSVTLLSTLRDPTQLRRSQCVTRHQHPIFDAHQKEGIDRTKKSTDIRQKKVPLGFRGFRTFFCCWPPLMWCFKAKNLKFLLLIRSKE